MESLPLSYVKAHLPEIVDRIESQHERVVVTRDRRPVAVLLSLDDLESLERYEAGITAEELIARCKSLPPVDYEKMRAELDAVIDPSL